MFATLLLFWEIIKMSWHKYDVSHFCMPFWLKIPGHTVAQTLIFHKNIMSYQFDQVFFQSVGFVRMEKKQASIDELKNGMNWSINEWKTWID